MSLQRRPCLSFDRLEERCVPAAAIFSHAGYLTILGDSSGNTIRVEQTAATTYDVAINGAAAKTFTGINKGMIISSGNGADDVSVVFTTDTSLTHLTISTDGGADTISVSADEVPVNLTLGTGGGTLAVVAGGGNDVVNLNALGTDGAILNIFGNVQLHGGRGSDTVSSGGVTNSSVFVSGNLAFIQANTAFTFVTTVSGVLTVVNAADTSLANVFTMDPSSSTGGDLGYIGGTGGDTVTLSGRVVGAVHLSTGNGDDAISVTELAPPALAGGLFIQTGAGNDAVVVDATVLGDSSIDLGNGDNTLTATSLIGPGFGGAVSVTAGSGADTVTWSTATGNLGVGNLDVNLGNGNNRLDLLVGGFVGGNLNVTTGSGMDTVSLSGGSVMGDATLNTGAGADTVLVAVLLGDDLTLLLGSGDDTATLAATAVITDALVADLGTGADSFDLAAGALVGGSATLGCGLRPELLDRDGAADTVTGLGPAVTGAITCLHFSPLVDLDTIDGGAVCPP